MTKKENLIYFLENNISKENINQIINNNNIDQEMIDTLWDLTISNTHPLSWRSAWMLHHLLNAGNKDIIRPHLHKMLDLLSTFTHNGQKREVLKIILLFDIEEIEMGKALNICFGILLSPKEALAVRVHAMQIIYNICKIEPELKSELIDVINIVMQEDSPALRGRGKMIQKKLKKIPSLS